jgi:septal ring factor EnvC (AmiA/AmiB activator)
MGKIDSQLWSKSKDVATIILIPAMIWIISAIVQFKTDQHKINLNIEKISSVEEKLHDLNQKDTEISIQIAKVETSIQMISKDIDEIKTMMIRLAK